MSDAAVTVGAARIGWHREEVVFALRRLRAGLGDLRGRRALSCAWSASRSRLRVLTASGGAMADLTAVNHWRASRRSRRDGAT